MKQVKLGSQLDISLTREASLASMSLGVGLTHLGKYSFASPGFFFHGMLSLGAGIERTLKLILIYDFRLNNKGAFPTDGHLKNFSHRLEDLVNVAIEIEKKHGISTGVKFLDEDPIARAILANIGDFAVRTRYYNLDLIGGKKQAGLEPLHRWDQEVGREIVSRHYRPKKGRIELLKQIAGAMEPHSRVMFTVENGAGISDMTSLMMQNELTRVKRKYSMFYAFLLVRGICDVLRELEYKGKFFPCLREFFAVFNQTDKNFILSRKTWNPMPPYHF